MGGFIFFLIIIIYIIYASTNRTVPKGYSSKVTRANGTLEYYKEGQSYRLNVGDSEELTRIYNNAGSNGSIRNNRTDTYNIHSTHNRNTAEIKSASKEVTKAVEKTVSTIDAILSTFTSTGKKIDVRVISKIQFEQSKYSSSNAIHRMIEITINQVFSSQSIEEIKKKQHENELIILDKLKEALVPYKGVIISFDYEVVEDSNYVSDKRKVDCIHDTPEKVAQARRKYSTPYNTGLNDSDYNSGDAIKNLSEWFEGDSAIREMTPVSRRVKNSFNQEDDDNPITNY
jgi:hypothetical protein